MVDATNYVMLELGQPMHAFDLDMLAEQRIVVRRARAGEKMRTLDGVERTLTTEMCVIADASRAVAIAGVMGGADSEIRSTSRNILLESAWFDPISIRRTSKALGLRTEASMRFERGADLEMAETASRRCAELIQQLGRRRIARAAWWTFIRDARKLRAIELTRKEFLRVMGADVPDAEIEAILAALGFAPVRSDAAATRSTAQSPAASWKCCAAVLARRRDARGGLDRGSGAHLWRRQISAAPARGETSRRAARIRRSGRSPARKSDRPRLSGNHHDSDCRRAERRDVPRREGAAPARIANPLAEDASVMRSTGAVTMARTLEWNLNHGQRNVRLFEFGKDVWLERNGAGGNAHPHARRDRDWRAKKASPKRNAPYVFADLKGDLDQIGHIAGGFAWNAGGPDWLHARARGKIIVARRMARQRQPIGHAGQLSRRISERFKLRQDAFIAELELEPLCAGYKAARAALRYKPLSRFPAVERDFSLVLADGTTFPAVVEAIRALGYRRGFLDRRRGFISRQERAGRKIRAARSRAIGKPAGHADGSAAHGFFFADSGGAGRETRRNAARM